ncbi:oligosaccharide flippase family protein [Bacillus sp. IITD106]|nr:oligosaccharide flippase family protein [Bacillus sp. IITD106]
MGFLKKLTDNKLINNIMKLMSATMIAQLISLALSPILTRMYTPEEYGVLTLFTTFVAILITFVTGRYEIAIVLPEKDNDSRSLLFGSVAYLLFMSLLIFVIMVVFHDSLIRMVGNESFSLWLYFVPLSLLVYGLYQNFNYWNNRFKNYNVIAAARITEASSVNLIQLLFGLLKLGSKGLIFGYIFGQFFATLVFSIGGRKNLQSEEKITFKSMKRQLAKYKEYPFYNMPSGFFDIMSIQLPNLFISKFFGATSLGFYSLSLRIVNAPLTFISVSVSQVLYQRLNEMYQKGEKLRKFILKAAGILSIISIIPFCILFFWGPDLFGLVYSDKWRVSGEISRIMAFALCVRLVVSPLSPAFFVLNRVKLLFILQMSRLFTTSIILLIGSKFNFSTFIVFYSIHEVCFYILYFIIIIYISSLQTLDKCSSDS